MKFILFSEYGEILDLAMALKDEGHEVLLHIQDHEYRKIGDGIIPKEKHWWKCVGQDYIWVFDGCENGNLQDWLRARGEAVFGGTELADKLENDRQLGQKLFKSAGFYQPESQNFKDFESAIALITGSDKRWILKQNGNAPKSINHMGKFDDGSDMLLHINELKQKWNPTEYGPVDFDLMEVVEGLEVAASGFFNGSDWLRNDKGKVVGYLNFEDKKEANGNTGETTGEMGTTFIGVDETNKLFSEILLKPQVTDLLKSLNYRGVFDINCIKTDKGIVALEPTCRVGVPATSYEFMEGLETPIGGLIDAVANGLNTPISVRPGIGMVMVIAAKPYPVEAHMGKEHTSLGEKLWFLKDGKPTSVMTKEQRQHIHLENFELSDSGYRVATGCGYLLTVTGVGKSIQDARDRLIRYIKDNIYISGMKYRTDIGSRIEEHYGVDTTSVLEKRHKSELAKRDKELSDIKAALIKAIHEEEE